jgi:hypothetical protein
VPLFLGAGRLGDGEEKGTFTNSGVEHGGDIKFLHHLTPHGRDRMLVDST